MSDAVVCSIAAGFVAALFVWALIQTGKESKK